MWDDNSGLLAPLVTELHHDMLLLKVTPIWNSSGDKINFYSMIDWTTLQSIVVMKSITPNENASCYHSSSRFYEFWCAKSTFAKYRRSLFISIAACTGQQQRISKAGWPHYFLRYISHLLSTLLMLNIKREFSPFFQSTHGPLDEKRGTQGIENLPGTCAARVAALKCLTSIARHHAKQFYRCN